MFDKPTDAELNNSYAFKKAFLDTAKTMSLLSGSSLGGTSGLICYVYCQLNNCFFVLHGSGKNTQYGKVRLGNGCILDECHFEKMHTRYCKTFIDIKEGVNKAASKEEWIELADGWKEMYSTFIFPWIYLYPGTTRFFIRLDYSKEGRRRVINFNSLYNFEYRLWDHKKPGSIFFTTITTEKSETFIRNIIGLRFPEITDINLLYGFKPFDRDEVLEASKTKERKNAAILREKIFQDIFSAIRERGGHLIYLHEIADFEKLLTWEGIHGVIQILSHYHNERLFTRSDKSISFKRLRKHIERLAISGQLRDDISIDAMTCTNFGQFDSFYDLGVKYIYMSQHDISTDLAAYMLYELHTGKNARHLSWSFPYLDGKCFLHEAWAKVSRCFYTRMAKGDLIEIL